MQVKSSSMNNRKVIRNVLHDGDLFEAMYFPLPRAEYSAARTCWIVGFTKDAMYLGSIIRHSLTSDTDVDERIKSTTAAFEVLPFMVIGISTLKTKTAYICL